MGFEWGAAEAYTVAYYRPRAFYIKLNFATESSGLHGLAMSRGLPTFLHEVGHLIQDRATLFGVADFLNFYKGLSSFRRYIDRSPRGEPLLIPARARLVNGCLPGDDTPLWIAEAEAVRDAVYPRVDWPADGRHFAHLGHAVEERECRLGERVIRHPVATVRLVDNVEGTELEHPLGAWEVKEAYSVAVAVAHGGPEPDPRQGYEYFVVDRILQRYFGQVDPAQTAAVCHWALQDGAPGPHLLRLVEALEAEGNVPLPPAAAVYDFCRRLTLERGYAAATGALCDELDARAAEHRRVNPDGNFVRALEWYARGARQYLGLNIDPGRHFPVDTFLLANSRPLSVGDTEAGLETLFREVAVPMLETANGFVYAVGGDAADDGVVFFVRSLSRLVNAVWSGSAIEWECPVFGGCELPLKADDCRSRPWDKGALEATCPMGAAAKYLDLHGRTLRRG